MIVLFLKKEKRFLRIFQGYLKIEDVTAKKEKKKQKTIIVCTL